MGAHHHRQRRRSAVSSIRGGWPGVLGVVLGAALLVIAIAAVVRVAGGASAGQGSMATDAPAGVSTRATPGRGSSGSSAPTSSASSAPTSSQAHSSSTPAHRSSSPAGGAVLSYDHAGPPAKPPVVTPQGMWWGVDSSGPITAAAIANVHGWYRGARPQFWGRYLNGSYAVTAKELAFARSEGIYIYLIVPDQNCSQCGGQDLCGNDRTAAQAGQDAKDALRAARKVGVPRGAVLWKDIEQVSSCHGEPTGNYLRTWERTLYGSEYRTGLYGNVHEQDFDFPVAYCKAVEQDPAFAHNVPLDMNEDEPRLGAPRGTTGPDNAPAFNPKRPHCAPESSVYIWQYGESITAANYTDIDQAKPDTPGLLAPDGRVT